MDAELLNPFLEGLTYVMKNTIGENPTKGEIFIRDSSMYKSSDVTVMIGVSGRVFGRVVVSMSDECARRISAKMMDTDTPEKLEETSISALCELLNMITANAAIRFEDAGYGCDISIPTLITGVSMNIGNSGKIKTVVIPLNVEPGDIEVNLCISQKEKSRDGETEKPE